MDNNFIVTPRIQEPAPFQITLAGNTFHKSNLTVEKNKTNTFTFEYCVSGTGRLCADNRVYELQPGDLFVLPAGTDCSYSADKSGDWHKIWFVGMGALFEQVISLYGLTKIYVYRDTDLEDVFNRLIDVLSDKTLSPEETNVRATLIFMEIILKMHEKSSNDTSISEDAKVLKNYLDYHIEEDISLDTLSKLIFRSKSQTIRIFKKNFGKTPYEYLLDNKISRSKVILEETNISIKELAYRLGFSDEHYFSNIFKAKTGVSPSFYRKTKAGSIKA